MILISISKYLKDKDPEPFRGNFGVAEAKHPDGMDYIINIRSVGRPVQSQREQEEGQADVRAWKGTHGTTTTTNTCSHLRPHLSSKETATQPARHKNKFFQFLEFSENNFRKLLKNNKID